jgi:hypothetical protein
VKAPIAQSDALPGKHRAVKSALSSDGTAKNLFKITLIAALVSFKGQQ